MSEPRDEDEAVPVRERSACRTCGEPIPSFAPGGNCPRCLLGTVPLAEESPGTVRLDERFTVIRQIGEGGFGRVYLAEQHEPVRRKVALKVLKPGMDTREVMARFAAERQVLARLEHSNIATVYEAGATPDGYPFFAMEYVPGEPLTEFADHEKLGLRERLALFCEVCRGVQHAHLNGIIHRDLKPGNLLARRDDDGGTAVRIIDFGIAKATRQELSDATLATLPRQAMGTPEYMAPEQAEGRRDIDARADVYSLGAILYELLSGAAPIHRSTFDGAGLSEVLEAVRASDPLRPSAKLEERRRTETGAVRPWQGRDLARDLDWIVMCALEKDRERRYQSVDAFAGDVRRFLDDEPVQARPPSGTYRVRKFVRRHRAASVAVLVTTLALVVGTLVSTLLALRAERARAEAVVAEQAAEQARDETARIFSRADYQQACGLLQEDEFGAGVAHLCRALRSDPENLAAADTLCSTLAYTNHLVPEAPEAHHPSRVIHLFFRGDDEFVTVSQGGVAGIWSRATGERIGGWMEHDRESILAAAHTADTRWLATITAEGTVRVWDLDKRSLRFRHESAPEAGGGEAICLLPNPPRVVAGSRAGTVRVWDVELGEMRWEHRFAHPIRALDVSVDGTLVAVSGGRSAAVLDAGTGEILQARMTHSAPVRVARFGPAGRRILTASEDGTARIWDGLTGDPLVEPLRHDELVYDAVWGPAGNQVATISFDDSARVWNASDGSPRTGALHHDDHVYACAFVESGLQLLTGSRDQRLRLWELGSETLAAAPAVHERSVSVIAVDSARGQVLSGGRHEQVRLLDMTPRASLPKRLRFPGPVVFSQSHADGAILRTLFRDGDKLVIGLSDPRAAQGLGRPLNLGRIVRIDTASASGHMVVQDGPRKVRILANTKGDPLLDEWIHPCDLKWVEIDAFGRFVYLGGIDGNATLLRFDAGEGKPSFKVLRTIRPFEGIPADDVIISGEPPFLAAKEGERVRVYSIDEDRWLPEGIRHPGGIGSWDYQADHKLLITGGFDDTARLWDADTGSLHGEPFEHADVGGERAVLAKLSPDGRLAVTSSWHELSARIWDTASGSLVTNPLYLNAHVESLAVDPESRYLATASDDRILRVWNMHSGYLALPEQRAPGLPSRGRFQTNGKGFVAVQGRETMLWRLPAISDRVPEWFLEFAESLVGLRLDDQGVLHRLRDRSMEQIRLLIPERGPSSEETFRDWASWIAADPAQRSPWVEKDADREAPSPQVWQNL